MGARVAPGGAGGRRAQVSPAATALTSADYLRYFYYAGMVFIGLKRYGDAIDMFQVGGQRPRAPRRDTRMTWTRTWWGRDVGGATVSWMKAALAAGGARAGVSSRRSTVGRSR